MTWLDKNQSECSYSRMSQLDRQARPQPNISISSWDWGKSKFMAKPLSWPQLRFHFGCFWCASTAIQLCADRKLVVKWNCLSLPDLHYTILTIYLRLSKNCPDSQKVLRVENCGKIRPKIARVCLALIVIRPFCIFVQLCELQRVSGTPSDSQTKMESNQVQIS